jgi:DNA-binding NarL/FixJ family response regulator
MSQPEGAVDQAGPDPVRVVVIDDHQAVRAGLERVLERAPGVELVMALADDRQLLELARDRQVDVVILDYDLERGDGLTTCLRVKQLLSPPAVAVYSGYAGPSLAVTAAVAQADALISKAQPIEELLAIIRQLSAGERLLANPARDLREAAGARLRREDLAVMAMLLDGMRLADIAEALGIDLRAATAAAQRVVGLLQVRRRVTRCSADPMAATTLPNDA